MTDTNFLCRPCREGMCNDCLEIADEYVELLQLRTNALQVANYQVEKLTEEFNSLKRKAAMWEELSKMGMPEIIIKWMDETTEARNERK